MEIQGSSPVLLTDTTSSSLIPSTDLDSQELVRSVVECQKKITGFNCSMFYPFSVGVHWQARNTFGILHIMDPVTCSGGWNHMTTKKS